MEGIIVDLEHAGTSVATLCTVRGHTSVGKAIVPDNGPRSEFSVRRAASGNKPVATNGVIFHEKKLVRAKPRIISPRSMTQIAVVLVVYIETLPVALSVNDVMIHDTITPASGAYGSVVDVIKEAMVNTHRVVRSVASADELNYPVLV